MVRVANALLVVGLLIGSCEQRAEAFGPFKLVGRRAPSLRLETTMHVSTAPVEKVGWIKCVPLYDLIAAIIIL
jgi:hypothetical protein